MNQTSILANNKNNTFIVRLRRIRQAQKCTELYSRFISRHFSFILTAILSYTPVTPNQVTVSLFFVGLLGAGFFCLGTSHGYIMGGSCFVILNILDTTDGELARYRRRTSIVGDYLDRLAHYVTHSALILGMGVGFLVQFGSFTLLFVALILQLTVIFDALSRDLLFTCGIVYSANSGERKQLKTATRIRGNKTLLTIFRLLGSFPAFYHIIIVCAVFDLLWSINLLVLNIPVGFVVGYFLFLFLVHFLRALIRIRTIYTNYLKRVPTAPL